MSEHNIRVVQSLYAAFVTDDIKAIIKASSAEVVWEAVGRPADYQALGRRTGLEGVAEFFQALHASEQNEYFLPLTFDASGDKVFVEGRGASTLKGSGRRIDTDWLHIFTIRNGQLIGFKQYCDTAQYLA